MLLSVLVLCVTVGVAAGQSAGDTIVVGAGKVRADTSIFADELFSVAKGDSVQVQAVSDDYYKIQSRGRTGWLNRSFVMTDEELQAYRKKKAKRRRQQRERQQYLEGLREKGYTLELLGQLLYANSADGVTVGLEFRNVSKQKTIKYLRITWQLFNPVGDPASGQQGTASVTETRFVGPVEPGERANVEFENLWYSAVGRCAVVRRIEVEHIDGSSFVYLNDLQDIDEYGAGVKLRGECSYAAQQESNQ